VSPPSHPRYPVGQAKSLLTHHGQDATIPSKTLFENLVPVVSASTEFRRIKGKAVRIGRGPATVIGEPTLTGV